MIESVVLRAPLGARRQPRVPFDESALGSGYGASLLLFGEELEGRRAQRGGAVRKLAIIGVE